MSRISIERARRRRQTGSRRHSKRKRGSSRTLLPSPNGSARVPFRPTLVSLAFDAPFRGLNTTRTSLTARKRSSGKGEAESATSHCAIKGRGFPVVVVVRVSGRGPWRRVKIFFFSEARAFPVVEICASYVCLLQPNWVYYLQLRMASRAVDDSARRAPRRSEWDRCSRAENNSRVYPVLSHAPLNCMIWFRASVRWRLNVSERLREARAVEVE